MANLRTPPLKPRLQGFAAAIFLLLAAALFAACGGNKYPKCDKDKQCADHGEVCVDGTCQQCRDNSQCPEGQQCKGGRCEGKAECSADADCTANKVCRSGKCQLECAEDADCGSGMKCKGNKCQDTEACKETRDCTGGKSCINGHCAQTDEASRNMNVNAANCDALPTVHFDFNESTLGADARGQLTQVADCLKAKGGTVTLEGHCDERGTEEYNLTLGDRRARAVEKFLAGLGVPGNKMNVVSKGKVEPADPGHNEEAWAKNRRVQFITR